MCSGHNFRLLGMQLIRNGPWQCRMIWRNVKNLLDGGQRRRPIVLTARSDGQLGPVHIAVRAVSDDSETMKKCRKGTWSRATVPKRIITSALPTTFNSPIRHLNVVGGSAVKATNRCRPTSHVPARHALGSSAFVMAVTEASNTTI